ncbi:MAG TPA: glycine cleavage system protein H [Candidatus Limnocylindrales bacterium]|nr:glycine cleavage system protein H [Candidatus Limnocylindrales bacterium]
MTVLLVVITIAIFLAIDYVRSRRKATQPAATAPERDLVVARTVPEYVAGFELPARLRYHPGHTWALRESPTLVRVGIDDFAARLVGKVDGVLLPKRGQWIRQGQKIFTALKDGNKAELVSPIEGEVTSVNEAVLNNAASFGHDPYGEGWLLTVMSPDAQTNFRNLLAGSLARQWMSETASRLRAKLPAVAGAVAQDGGLAMRGLTDHLPDEQWSSLTREFFLP